ncbi:MAG: hypothetical protein V4702_02130 [Patescibacteria group bacterium]
MNLYNRSQLSPSPSQERARVPAPVSSRIVVLNLAKEFIENAVATYPATSTATTSQETSLSPNTHNVDFHHSPAAIIQPDKDTTSNTGIDVVAAATIALAEATSSNQTLAAMGETLNA